MTALRLTRTALVAVAAFSSAVACFARADAAPRKGQLQTLFTFPDTGNVNGNMASDGQGGYFVPWMDQGGVQEVLDVRVIKKKQWGIIAVSPSINFTTGQNEAFLASDGAGGVNIASCSEMPGQRDVIGNVHPVSGGLAVFTYDNQADLSSGSSHVCQYNNIVPFVPTQFFVSNSYTLNGFNINGVKQVAFTGGQWVVTPITMDGGNNVDTVAAVAASNVLIGKNDSGSKGNGELFSLTINGSTGTYQTIYDLKSKLGDKFYDLASTGVGQFVASTTKAGDGVTVAIVQGKKKLTAKKMGSNTGMYEQLSVSPDAQVVWGMAHSDVFGDEAFATPYTANGGKYHAGNPVSIPAGMFPETLSANDDGSANAVILGENTGIEYLVSFPGKAP